MANWKKDLKPGDRVWVDCRALFLDQRLLREAEFIGWLNPDLPAWHCNSAIIRGPGFRRSPTVSLHPDGDGTYLVLTIYLHNEQAFNMDNKG